jgi:hypothetical protein
MRIATPEDLKALKEKLVVGTKFKLTSGVYMDLFPHIRYEVIDTPTCLPDVACNAVHCKGIGRKVIIKNILHGRIVRLRLCLINTRIVQVFYVSIESPSLGLFIREEDYLI